MPRCSNMNEQDIVNDQLVHKHPDLTGPAKEKVTSNILCYFQVREVIWSIVVL